MGKADVWRKIWKDNAKAKTGNNEQLETTFSRGTKAKGNPEKGRDDAKRTSTQSLSRVPNQRNGGKTQKELISQRAEIIHLILDIDLESLINLSSTCKWLNKILKDKVRETVMK
jgi:hypothetical protein